MIRNSDIRSVQRLYIESIVTTYPFAVEIDYETNRVRPVGGAEPSVTISAPPAR